MKLLITRKIPQNALEQLSKYKEIEIDYREGSPLTKQELLEAIKGVDAIIPVIPDKIDKDIINSAGSKLKLIAHYAVGFDNIDVEYATTKNIYVSNTPGNLTESVAEFVLGLMFAISKKIVASDKYVRDKEYKYWDPMAFLGPKISGKTLGIVGMGRIGYYLGEMAKNGLNMKILYYDPKQCVEADEKLAAQKVSLEQLLENSDFVSLNCFLCDATYHLIGEKELKLMKPTAYLINTARGPIINEAALYTALKEQWIEGAALDVFEDEPNVYKDLDTLSNVILTPHIASATYEARIQMANMVVDNVVDVLINKIPPRNLVNKELVDKRVHGIV